MNFHEAYKEEFWSRVVPRTSHIRHIHIQGDHNNNKMERLNGEVRDREKVIFGSKKMDSPIFKGYQLYHNYFKDHDALDAANCIYEPEFDAFIPYKIVMGGSLTFFGVLVVVQMSGRKDPPTTPNASQLTKGAPFK